MSNIYFPGGGTATSGTGVSGINDASGALYVLRDGTRYLTGNLVPDAHNSRAIGTSGAQFSSGVFRGALIIDNIRLESRKGISNSDKGGLVVIDNDLYPNIVYRTLRADQFQSNPATAFPNGRKFYFGNAALTSWVNADLPTATMEVNISRKFAGMLRVGTTAAGSAGGVVAQSGIFQSGVVLIAPNGSGWLVTLNANNQLVTIGPLVV